MQITAHDVLTAAVALIGLVTTLLQRHRAKQAGWMADVASAIALVEKYAGGQPEASLEEEAVRLIHERWPRVPEAIVRLAIREACRRRKLAASEAGLRE